jgi:hypothetical protein
VQDPVGLQMDGPSLSLVTGSPGKLRGKLIRHPAFKQPVNLVLMGLPAGYSASGVTVPGDKADFEMPITVAKELAARTLPNVSIAVSLANGKVAINQPVELKISTAPTPAPAPQKKK